MLYASHLIPNYMWLGTSQISYPQFSCFFQSLIWVGLEEAAGTVGGGDAHYHGGPLPSSHPHVYPQIRLCAAAQSAPQVSEINCQVSREQVTRWGNIMTELWLFVGHVPVTLSPQYPGLLSQCLLVFQQGFCWPVAGLFHISSDWHFRQDYSLGGVCVWQRWAGDCPVHCRMFSSTLEFFTHWISVASPLFPIKNVSRHCHMFPREQDLPIYLCWESLA